MGMGKSSGWRDTDGRTAAERKAHAQAAQRASFIERVRDRPLSLVRPLLIGLFFALIILAVALRYL